ncbi:MAG: RdgB/HAM1 family non-canonical purine NTP pyrophosphatase [Absicoccus sp.]|uniref:dITP/XTP pyrophosphatase n=1 Tax=Absicoccus intestinalis TaxID=2926319 RepID=A0ABU4WM51_9FIRM|nr:MULTISPECIES: RdgB/HAM1 family non-canonical purine NTP pyrophosphatase [unclassified Absicoccus]MDX8416863.1 RdgB/HAM1 family non-canonical purine NTP pyrophosphatase [Absicoccus sp. CLA-KB-P134]MDY3035343.1 RdgB/HAM1 family non-canonical purine NTP pyrophosphatase [Absicoccus sp.]
MKTIWIATSNPHKVEEFQTMLGSQVQVKSMKDLDQEVHIVENGKTFEENALIKARALYQVIHQPVLSDDSGLEVDALNKQPGVHSARWMGKDTSYTIKNQAIIDALKGKKDRSARFICVIAFIDEQGKEYTYRGTIEGQINDEIVGKNGFGYDPIFYYPPFHTTTANVSEELKNSVSHRGNALKAFMADWKDRL